ncbi:MAG: hypothetical protein WBW33_09595, partial [Bryobacteraceae bacterium]
MEHISEGDLLLYCMGLVQNEDELGPIEEHLLWCQECLGRVAACDAALTERLPNQTHKAADAFASGGQLLTESFRAHTRLDYLHYG